MTRSERNGVSVMGHSRRIAAAGAAALIVSGLATAAAAHDRRFLHPPIHVATLTGGSPITPYFYPYGSRYRYAPPGPVYYELDYWGPDQEGCRLWGYNFAIGYAGACADAVGCGTDN
jgi:hypothetical protein